MTEYRERGKKALSKVVKIKKNIGVIDNIVYEFSKKKENTENVYLNLIYQCIDFMEKNKNSKKMLQIIEEDKLNWNHSFFENIKNKQEEQDEFILKPFEVEEGVLQCNNCGSKRTISYQKQQRSCDESATTFAKCCKCRTSWIYSG
jgi:DNA-directed RNA polymerase subunit M/transcription elongation factor TFIIS